tara:strand:+ start:6191 stop:7342 length:1152 start_codon:yes stop_codon:yes gene_type:complete
MNPKIALINIYFTDYKMKLFELLHMTYDITYLITRKSKEHTETIEGTQNFKIKHFKPYNFFRGILALGVLKDLIFSNYDIVISHDPHTFESILGCYIMKLKRKKFIIYSETWDWPRAPYSKLLNPFLKVMYKLLDATIVSSKKSKNYFYKKGYPSNKKSFLSLPPSLEYFNPQLSKKDLEQHYPQTKNKTILLYLNRIVPYKGLDILIKAFSLLERKDLTLIVCGTDDPAKRTRNKNYFNEVKTLINRLKLDNIIFTDYSEENKSLFYNLCDVFIAPVTMRDYDGESWGYTPEEAMSAQKPIIATDAMGCSNEIILNNENGFVVPHNDVNHLSYAINKLISNPQLIQKMGKKSREIWETITWEQNFEGYKKAIDYAFNPYNLS